MNRQFWAVVLQQNEQIQLITNDWTGFHYINLTHQELSYFLGRTRQIDLFSQSFVFPILDFFDVMI